MSSEHRSIHRLPVRLSSEVFVLLFPASAIAATVKKELLQPSRKVHVSAAAVLMQEGFFASTPIVKRGELAWFSVTSHLLPQWLAICELLQQRMAICAGLNTWHDLEDKKINFALAMRMLYACTHHTGLQKTYSNFLEVHASALQKSQLTAYDVLVFIASSCGISKVQPCCISFGFDEVQAHCLCG